MDRVCRLWSSFVRNCAKIGLAGSGFSPIKNRPSHWVAGPGIDWRGSVWHSATAVLHGRNPVGVAESQDVLDKIRSAFRSACAFRGSSCGAARRSEAVVEQVKVAAREGDDGQGRAQFVGQIDQVLAAGFVDCDPHVADRQS